MKSTEKVGDRKKKEKKDVGQERKTRPERKKDLHVRLCRFLIQMLSHKTRFKDVPLFNLIMKDNILSQ